MTLSSFLVFLPAVYTGALIIHLLWNERGLPALLLKVSLGIGIGLGLSSILYFLTLLVVPGRINILLLELGLATLLTIVVLVRESPRSDFNPGIPKISRLQYALIAANIIAFGIFVLTFVDLVSSRPQGGFDAWSIWNRSARFIYRDPGNWRATVSPELDWQNHADYPLLVPLNVAWGWQSIGTETLRIPMAQSALFTLGCLAILFASVAFTRTIGQASLATLVLMGTPAIVVIGSRLIADIPLGFYILATGVFIFLASKRQNLALQILAGFSAGLAAWTKNEGLLFVLAYPIALILMTRKNLWRTMAAFFAGAAIPLAVVLYFKSVAPAGDLFVGGAQALLARATDLSRYWIILRSLQRELLTLGGWPFGILLPLTLYAVFMRFRGSWQTDRGLRVATTLVFLQLLGYCAIYVLSPYDLQWHLDTSLYRLLPHLFPAALFLLFVALPEPDRIFSTEPEKVK